MPRKKTPPPPKIPRPGYSFADVLALTSATKSNLLHWANIGIVTAAIEDTVGSGYPRRFSPLNVIEVELCAFVNRFRVPTEVIRGAVNVFRGFHYDAVALYEEVEQAPLMLDPPHLALFRSADHRQRQAHSFIKAQFPPYPTEEDMYAAADYAKAMARVWAELRSGPLVRGVPDPSWSHFLGLFIGGDHDYAVVALNPPASKLHGLVSDSAIVIDLPSVVFRVGQRCRHGSLGAW